MTESTSMENVWKIHSGTKSSNKNSASFCVLHLIVLLLLSVSYNQMIIYWLMLCGILIMILCKLYHSSSIWHNASFNSFIILNHAFGAIILLQSSVLVYGVCYSLISFVFYLTLCKDDHHYNNSILYGLYASYIIAIILSMICRINFVLSNYLTMCVYFILLIVMYRSFKASEKKFIGFSDTLGKVVHDIRNHLAIAHTSIEEIALISSANIKHNVVGKYNLTLSSSDYEIVKLIYDNCKIVLNQGLLYCGNITKVFSELSFETSNEMRLGNWRTIVSEALNCNLMSEEEHKRIKVLIEADSMFMGYLGPSKIMIQIIVLNFLKFYRSSEIAISIQDNDKLVIINNQCNLDMLEFADVFNPLYYHKHQKYNWDGLGLHLCTKIASEMGYSISCEAKSGQYIQMSIVKAERQ